MLSRRNFLAGVGAGAGALAVGVPLPSFPLDKAVLLPDVVEWDFAAALGDTIKEKHEQLYVKLVETSLGDKPKLEDDALEFTYLSPKHPWNLREFDKNWILTSPQIASIFECATSGFYPEGYYPGYAEINGIIYTGTINMRWRLYKTLLVPINEIWLGFKDDDDKTPFHEHLAQVDKNTIKKIVIKNFII